ncbi:hypothetical protein BKA65DRAFT_473516 [Rhexocercosporidium sp. MPI-PUGE-AT-0058]|nr:hypothetical protein BKA65DRAFT_473516 [Rhexocercosporidium sp. MPI-PUGE-AT-0058]
MPRRPHRKSRNGCLGCKKRHIKCNEGHPSCSNCINAEMTCVYQNKAPPSSSQSPAAGLNCSASSLPSPAATNLATASSYWSPASEQASLDQGIVNMLYLELLDHAKTVADTVVFFGISKEDYQTAIRDIIQHALSTPYLMHEILSVAATHLSTIRPSQSVFLRNQATELQTSALSIFNRKMQSVSDDILATDYFSRFVFSSLLGSHMLYDTIAFRDGDFTVFIENFVRYLHVTKGVTLNVHGFWELLHETSLRPFLEAGERSFRGGSENFIPECERLEALLKTADLGPASSKAYEDALSYLKQSYRAHRRVADAQPPPDSSSLLLGGSSGVYAWPILVSTEYAELVLQKRPEALAILAHYGVLLHRYRDSGMVGDGGQYIIEAITKYLGPYWEEWLASPNEELQKDSRSFDRSPQPNRF